MKKSPASLILLAGLALIQALAAESIEKLTIAENPATIPAEQNHWLKKHLRYCELGKTQPVDVLFMGDSISEQWHWGSGQPVWDNYFGKCNAASFGIGGDRTEHVLWRIEHGTLDAVSPKLVVLLIGTNNLRDTSVEDTAEGVAACAKAIKQHLPKTKILLFGIFPRAQSPEDPMRAKIAAVNAKIATLARFEDITYLDIGNEFLEPDGTISADTMPDTLHLSTKAYTIWAKAIVPYLPPATTQAPPAVNP